jgi:cysteine-rich repeat protein
MADIPPRGLLIWQRDSVKDPGEGCDDGNDTDGDGCQSGCKLPACGDGVPGCAENVCGDGVLDTTDEVCDDGDNQSGDGCSADCQSTEECGNGVLDPGEVCFTTQTVPIAPGPLSLAVGNLDADTALDIAVTHRAQNRVGVLLGNGDGSFQAKKLFPVGSGPNSIAAADINGDGAPDLVTADFNSGTASLLLSAAR